MAAPSARASATVSCIYTDTTQPHGIIYGKCSQTAQIDPKTRLKLR
jgi:hypothetical protein